MGRNSQFLKGTAETLRRIANEADKNYVEAEAALTDLEAREARVAQRETVDVTGKYPALEGR